MRWLLFASLCCIASAADAGEPKEKDKKGGIELKLVAKKDTYEWTHGDPKAFQKTLDDIAAIAKKKPFAAKAPKSPEVDLVLQIHNSGPTDTDVWVEGDANLLTLDLKGPAVRTLPGAAAFTLELRLSKMVTIPSGKSFEIPLRQLSDGHRRVARNLYWAEPGEYTLTAQYQLSAGPETRGPVLKSNAVTLKVKDK